MEQKAQQGSVSTQQELNKLFQQIEEERRARSQAGYLFYYILFIL